LRVKTRITIRGRTYTVQGDEDDGDLVAVAAFVDSRMADVAKRAPGLDDFSVAMLAALNIASEYERLRESFERELEGLDRDLAAVSLLVDHAASADVDE
jgi:cell division protein ZapA